MKLPNFFIVGAPKAGTTSLYSYLDQHPRIYMSPLKETYYFSSEIRAENFLNAEARTRIERDQLALQKYLAGDMREKRFGGVVTTWDNYLKLFQSASDEIAIGEATPHYLWSPCAAHGIAARIPHAKILISLRNPVDRAYSNYLHMLAVGAADGSFRQEIEADLRRLNRRVGLEWPFLEYGQYTQQIKRYFQEFPRSQIHISFYEELQRSPATLVSSLYSFLGVGDFPVDVSLRHNEPVIPRLPTTTYLLRRSGLWPLLRSLAPASLRQRLQPLLRQSRASLLMDPADRAFLTDFYREDIARLATLLDRDLDGWLRPVDP